MPRIAVMLELKQIENMIQQLTAQDRIALIRRLERKAWKERFGALTAKIDKRRKKYPVTQKQINRLVKAAREDRYEARRP
jgi:hypothetical protein